MIDLKQLMEERSSQPPALADLRYPRVRHRISRRRRRRVAVLATAVAVVLAVAGGYAALPRRQASPEPITPSPTGSPARVSEGFPPFAFGRKMVHSETAPLSDRKVTLTWTPTTLNFHTSQLCYGLPERVYLRGTMFVNGHQADGIGCDARHTTTTARGEDWLRSGWIREGEPITLTHVFEEAVKPQDNSEVVVPMPSGGTIMAAIYAPVPFEEYQLPPRPAQLPPLADWSGCKPEHLIASDPRNPLRPMSVTVPWQDLLNFRWDTQTPGLLRLSVDGVEIATVGWWDYGGLNWSRFWNTAQESEWAGIPGWKFPAQGQQVTITFTPEHFTGRWQASLDHLLPGRIPVFCR